MDVHRITDVKTHSALVEFKAETNIDDLVKNSLNVVVLLTMDPVFNQKPKQSLMLRESTYYTTYITIFT